jgi:RNA 3'-terminal phosphate cyclase (ATP)
MLTIDGSQGEGGGQILRTSLALSLVTGKPFRIDRIRHQRSKPGLMKQHLAAVQAAAEVGAAQIEGVHLGSRVLTFSPETIRSGRYLFSVGTAGSCTLVLQTVLPALCLASGGSDLILEGGTHNPFAPPFEFMARAFLPLIRRMGPRVTAGLKKHGFYPAGGGHITVHIEPAPCFAPIDIPHRGDIRAYHACATVARLPRHIAQRELRTVGDLLGWEEGHLSIEDITGTQSPGNVLSIEITSEHITEIFTGFGERRIPAEQVARQACEQARKYLTAGVPVGTYLADQLLLPMALSGGGSFRTLRPTRHFLTNVEVIKAFLDVAVEIKQDGPGRWEIRIAGTPPTKKDLRQRANDGPPGDFSRWPS